LAGSSAEHSVCVRLGIVRPATDVDHIKPHRGDQALFWGPENHQSLCGTCHDSVKQTFEKTGRITGSDAKGEPLDALHPWNKLA
jgi:5-methylcytosine-specific restriction protein A